MSLTKQDLAAIKKIVNDRVDLSDQIAAESFEDVYQRLDGVDERLENLEDGVRRIENIQQVELERNDRQDKALQKLLQVLHVD